LDNNYILIGERQIVIFQHFQRQKREEMSKTGEKMSGGFLPLYVVKEGKINHK